ncbi:MAG TPA: substrate-binding domain-containing protein [Ruminiclostridium sp.]
MKKILSAIVTVAVSMSLLSGCGSSSAPKVDSTTGTTEQTVASTATVSAKKAPVIAFICKDLSQQWFVDTSTAMKEAVMARGAKDMIMLDCGMSPDKYMTALDNVIAQKIDVLIVCPPDQKLSQITVDRCKEAGIKVFADDDGLIDASGKHIAPALELDAFKVGQSQGDWLGDYVVKNKVNADPATTGYIVLTMSEVSSCVPRSEGALDSFKKKVADFPADKIIKADYDGTSDKAFNVAAATITAHPEIKTWIVTAPNDEGAQGATRALEQAGKDKAATVVGLGGYLGKDEFKKDFSCFKAAAYIKPSEDGKIAGNAAMDWYEKDIVPYSEYIKDGEQFGIYPFGAMMVEVSTYKEIMGADAN